jgi:transmembrane sensor
MNEPILDQALRWHAATARADCDWQQFTEWLEASPQHREAYDDVALLEQRIAHHRPALAAAAAPVARGRSRAWAGAAVAAGLALVAVFGARQLLPLPGAGERTYTVQSGTARELLLADGMKVTLAAGSSLQVGGRRDERIRLDGSAWFDVPHDPRRQLVITAGPYQLRDIGTRFEAMSAAGQLKVAVTEGTVDVVLPGREQPFALAAGHRLLVAGSPPIAEYGEAVASEVAAWRDGRLVFRNEPLSMVALQVGRHAGLAVTVDPSIAQRRFSGVLAIGDDAQPVAELGRIMDLQVQREGTAVHLSAAGSEPAGG